MTNRSNAYFTPDELKRFWEAIDNPDDLFLLQFCYYFGLRVSCLLQVEASDVDIKHRELKVRNSTAKKRHGGILTIPKEFLPVLKWKMEQPGLTGKLFRCSRCAVWSKVKKYASKAGIDTAKAFPHALRASLACAIYKQTGDVKLIQQCLLHKNPATSLIYVRMSSDETREALDRVNL